MCNLLHFTYTSIKLLNKKKKSKKEEIKVFIFIVFCITDRHILCESLSNHYVAKIYSQSTLFINNFKKYMSLTISSPLPLFQHETMANKIYLDDELMK